MNNTRWTPDEDQLLIEHRHSHYFSELVELLRQHGFERSQRAIETRSLRLRLSFSEHNPIEGLQSPSEGRTGPLRGVSDIQYERIDPDECFEELVVRSKADIPSTQQSAIKIVSISDLHIPFQNDIAVRKIVEKHKGADILIVNGDFLDMYCVSVFGKAHRIPLVKEYMIALEYLKLFSESFGRVILTQGNHESRIHKYFAKMASQEVIPMMARPILERLKNGEVYSEDGELVSMTPFPNVEFQKTHSWYTQVGKTIFAHPEKFLAPTKTGTLRTAMKTMDYFLGKKNFDCVVLGHTHKLGEAIADNTKVIEQGCLCGNLEYAVDNAKLNYGLQTLGYAVIYQDESGNTDFEKSHSVFMQVIDG